ncbi:MAG: SusC/RagA family TonB-linked outer membrane protein [Sphingobacteriales bacterium]|nr:SusC/RagA family TonB-linked outer membrane protein [Sphingobacteriales bacterium]
MKKLIQSLFILLFIASAAIAQDRTITGTVSAKEDGLPLPGVSVKVKGTNMGAQTDPTGKFALKVSGKGSVVLVFSYVGFLEKEVSVTGNKIVVQLETDAKQLSEVVVTAQGIERTRGELPYATQSVDGAEVSKTRNSNFVSGLSGKIAGLDIKQNNTLGGSVNVVLRGNKSLTQSNQALFVIDGVPVNNDLFNSGGQSAGRGGYDYGSPVSDLNPDNIASINVLKGAAASALYGSRASNGVIVITTKKGRQGLGITVNSGISVASIDKTTFVKYQKQYGQGYGQYYENPGTDNNAYKFLYRDINGDGTPDLVSPLSEDASYGAKFDPNLMVYQWDAFDPNSPNFGKARPWVAAANDPTTFFTSPVSYNNSIFINGGNEKSTFKLGYTRNDDKGILPNSKIAKDLLNFGATFNINKNLVIGGDINYTREKGLGRYGTGYDDKNVATNFRQWWPVNVDIKEQEAAYFRNKLNSTWNYADPTDLVPIYWDNPYFSRYENFEDDQRNRYLGNVNANLKATEWLDVTGRISLDQYNTNQNERQAVGSVTVPHYILRTNSFKEWNYDLLLNFHKDISKSLKFKGILGTNIRRSEVSQLTASTNGGLVVPRLYALSNSTSTPNAPSEFYGVKEVDGIFAAATFNYKELFTLDMTGRRDASSTLPKGNNVYYYPSISGSFQFGSLLKNSKLISSGKLRANYAEVGNDAPFYSINDTYNSISPFGSTTLFSVSSVKNNTSLRPEKTNSVEVGLEMGFLKDRLGFDLTLYKTNTKDQILPVAVTAATGYTTKYVNSGNVENKGIELSLFGTPIQTKKFSWNTTLNFTANRNKVLELYEGVDNLLIASYQGGVSINATKGEPYGVIKGRGFVFTDGQKTVSTTTGRYLNNGNSNTIIGNVNPDWTAGFNNSFRYKDIALSFLIDIKKGGDLFSLDRYYGLATGNSVETVGLNALGNDIRLPVSQGGGVLLPGVKPDGTPNDKYASNVGFGLFGYAYTPAQGFIYDASYVKLREAALTYSLPASLVSKLGAVKGVDLSLVGRNLWIIHKNLPDADPEDGIVAGNAQGYQGGSYPTARTIGFNLKFKF